MVASLPAGYAPKFVHTPEAKAGSVLVYNGQVPAAAGAEAGGGGRRGGGGCRPFTWWPRAAPGATAWLRRDSGALSSRAGQCWHSGGSHPGAPGVPERHSLFAHYRKSYCVFQCAPTLRARAAC
jgi:hypothetical protein